MNRVPLQHDLENKSLDSLRQQSSLPGPRQYLATLLPVCAVEDVGTFDTSNAPTLADHFLFFVYFFFPLHFFQILSTITRQLEISELKL